MESPVHTACIDCTKYESHDALGHALALLSGAPYLIIFSQALIAYREGERRPAARCGALGNCDSFGMPSSHAQTVAFAWALYACSGVLASRRPSVRQGAEGTLLGVLALVVCYARVYLGYHDLAQVARIRQPSWRPNGLLRTSPGSMASGLCCAALCTLLVASLSCLAEGKTGYRRALLFGFGDVSNAVTTTVSNPVAAVTNTASRAADAAQPYVNKAASGARDVADVARDGSSGNYQKAVDTAGKAATRASGNNEYVAKAASGARDTASIAKSVQSGDNAGAVNKVGSGLHAAGADNDCKDNTVGSKVCNGVFGGAQGANSVATNGVDVYTGKKDPRTAIEASGQTVTDAVVNSAGTELNRAGVENDCQGKSAADWVCQKAGGAKAVNGEISGGIQVGAAALAGTYDSKGAQEIANNASPAIVKDAADAAKQAGVDNDCKGKSVTDRACQVAGGGDKVNGAATTAVNQKVKAPLQYRRANISKRLTGQEECTSLLEAWRL
ncbi:hypothetical protein WJX81_008161 [Elliptochloris bilobata]|uniref:Phosphatidic acid phosphatase type 2/haloperoxidase domain-containing protein n=1 Tax=Elliptochloris bilobata TaxID=381761 RepID=A0AAW1RUX5_9CHLO